jgi:hypothetical protein
MTSVQAIYPNAIFSWTDKVDEVNVVFAVDPNSIAADLIAVENTLGTNPQTEPSPPLGNPVTYTSVSARITDAMNCAQMPVAEISSASATCPNTIGGQVNQYRKIYDPYGAFNGVDITIPADGWWIITTTQTWSQWDSGYSHHSLCLNGIGNILCDHLVNWEFPGNSTFNGIPGRWQQFGLRPITSYTTWQGLCHAGDRFSGVSENGTTNASQNITSLSMKASMIRGVTGNFTSG